MKREVQCYTVHERLNAAGQHSSSDGKAYGRITGTRRCDRLHEQTGNVYVLADRNGTVVYTAGAPAVCDSFKNGPTLQQLFAAFAQGDVTKLRSPADAGCDGDGYDWTWNGKDVTIDVQVNSVVMNLWDTDDEGHGNVYGACLTEVPLGQNPEWNLQRPIDWQHLTEL